MYDVQFTYDVLAYKEHQFSPKHEIIVWGCQQYKGRCHK